MTANPIWITLDGFEPGAAAERFLRDAAPYGVILFARHLKSPEQTRELCLCVREALGGSARLALDQEGGRVSRLAALGFSFPGASELQGDCEKAGASAREMGGVLRSLGFDVDFAPVADLGPAAPGTGLEGRLYGDDPETVSACCAAFLGGLAESGVEGCLKHFPGLGGSAVDSHSALPEIPGGGTAREAHLEPYRRRAGRAPYVMTAHGLYESLGGALPSSLEPGTYALLSGLGFGGLSVTDDLGMGAVSGRASLPELAASALQAGASLALWVSNQEETLRALDALEKAPAFLATRALLVDSMRKEA